MRRLAARVFAWSRALWQRRAIRRTVAEEIAFHVDTETDARRGLGLSPFDARRSTLADFGNPTLVRAEILDVRTPSLVRLVDGIVQDIRYAARTFARTPLTIASVVIVLAIAIGVTSTVFAAIDAVFFKPLAVPHPDRIVYVSGPGSGVDLDAFVDRAEGAIDRAAGTQPTQGVLSNRNLQVRAKGEEVGADYFTTLELVPTIGRFFNSGETNTGDGPVDVVISYELWKSRLGTDASILGQTIQFEGQTGTIIGVAPAGFRGVSLPWQPSQFWVIQARPANASRTVSAAIVARLSSGVSASALAAAVTRHDQTEPDAVLRSFIVRKAAGPLVPEGQLASFGFVRALADTVAAMALVVMLIAASNVVGILLARGVARSTELAVRQALGAGARRLAQQLATESLLLGLAAGAAGVFVAWLLILIYRVTAPSDIAIDADINARVLGVTLVVCSIAGLLVGIAPVRQALRVDLLAALGAPGATIPMRTRRRLRYGAVVPQIALSVALLVVAGAHARALWAVEMRSPGYELDDLVSMRVSPPMRFQKRDAMTDATNREYFRTVLEQLSRTTGVSGVGLASATPSQAAQFHRQPLVTRGANGAGMTTAFASGDWVSANFFSAAGIPLIAGRTFDDKRDRVDTPGVVIVSLAFARAIAPEGQAVGRLVEMGKLGSPGQKEWEEIAGVVGDIRSGIEVVPMVYRATSQSPAASLPLTLMLRVTGDPSTVTVRLARDVAAIDSRAQIEEAVTEAEILARAHFVRRLTLALVGVAGLFGVVLAAIGLYSAVSYSVAQQQKSLAVRATLGASGGQLLRLVVGDGARTVLIALLPGICIGLVGFRMTAGLLAFVAGPVAAPDLAVVATVCLVVGALSVSACLLPGWRAARVSPVVLLK